MNKQLNILNKWSKGRIMGAINLVQPLGINYFLLATLFIGNPEQYNS